MWKCFKNSSSKSDKLFIFLESTIQDGQHLDISSSNEPSFEGFTEQDLIADREAPTATDSVTSTQSMSPFFRVTPHITMLQCRTSENLKAMDTSIQRLKTYVNETTNEKILSALNRSCQCLSTHLQRFINYHEKQQQHTVYSTSSSMYTQ